MAVTQAEAAKFTTNSVKRGVLETIVNDSVVMQRLPFQDIVGNAWQYLQENSIPAGDFYSPNEVWSESTPDYTQLTATLSILGKDADVDNFLKATRSDKMDFAAEVIAGTAKGVKHTFLRNFYYGSTAANAKSFNGLSALLTTSSHILAAGSGGTPGALSFAALEDLIDVIRDGAGDVLLCTRGMRTRLNRFIRGTGTILVPSVNKYGDKVTDIDGLSIYTDDFLTATETTASGKYGGASTGGAGQSIWITRFGPSDLVGLQNGGLVTKRVGPLEDKDAERVRIRWYCGLALTRDLGTVSAQGISTAAVVA